MIDANGKFINVPSNFGTDEYGRKLFPILLPDPPPPVGGGDLDAIYYVEWDGITAVGSKKWGATYNFSVVNSYQFDVVRDESTNDGLYPLFNYRSYDSGTPIMVTEIAGGFNIETTAQYDNPTLLTLLIFKKPQI